MASSKNIPSSEESIEHLITWLNHSFQEPGSLTEAGFQEVREWCQEKGKSYFAPWPGGEKEEWKYLLELKDDENRARNRKHMLAELESFRNRIHGAFSGWLISEWVEENFKAKEQSEKDKIEREVDRYAGLCIRDNRSDDLSQFLTDVLRFGLKKANRKRVLREKGFDVGSYWGHAWGLLIGILQLGIVVRILDISQSKFESTVLSSLVIIYCAITKVYSPQGFGALARVEKEAAETDQEYRQKLKRSSVRFHIKAVVGTLMWVIAIFSLLKALDLS